MRAAVNVKHFTRDECCIVEIHHRINDLIDFAHSADRLKTFQKVMGFDFVHRRFYGSESDRVDPYALPRYSIASARATACNPPLVSPCNAHGTPAIG